MTDVRILIVDDHQLLRFGVRRLLEEEPGWKVCGEATTGRDAIEIAVDLKPDVIVLDINLPDVSGITVAREIRRSLPIPIVFLTLYDSPDLELNARRMGATAFLRKTGAAHGLVDAVRATLSRKLSVEQRAEALEESEPSESAEELDHLTPREREVLRLLAEGHTNKEVASRLGISTKTAETHRARIISKLGLSSVSGLVRYAIRHRIIEP